MPEYETEYDMEYQKRRSRPLSRSERDFGKDMQRKPVVTMDE
jgi:hypothetical protein